MGYDPMDAPEFIPDEHGGGIFSWMPVTNEGTLLASGEEYAEQSFEVPTERLDYMEGAGFLQAHGDDEDYRAYVQSEVINAHGREWRRVVLKGRKESVRLGGLRLMAGVLRRRPWDAPPAPLPSPSDGDFPKYLQ